jgi:three-Cys-motif partner protein
MVLCDSDPKKWILKEHTRVKHEILDKYLTPWIFKLSSAYNTLLYIDGFAGRGEYFEENNFDGVGSPIIAMRKVQQYKDKVPNFLCLFIE